LLPCMTGFGTLGLNICVQLVYVRKAPPLIIRREALTAVMLSYNGFRKTKRETLIDAIIEGCSSHCIYQPPFLRGKSIPLVTIMPMVSA